jgi:3-methyladenine DNA glycosylase/8-oxoguanine DNA glycosylase
MPRTTQDWLVFGWAISAIVGLLALPIVGKLVSRQGLERLWAVHKTSRRQRHIRRKWHPYRKRFKEFLWRTVERYNVYPKDDPPRD